MAHADTRKRKRVHTIHNKTLMGFFLFSWPIQNWKSHPFGLHAIVSNGPLQSISQFNEK